MLFHSLTKTYGVNSSKYGCFTHRSTKSTLTVLHIKKYPQTTIVQVILSLSLSGGLLLLCTIQMCQSNKRQEQAQNRSRKKMSEKSLKFNWTKRI